MSDHRDDADLERLVAKAKGAERDELRALISKLGDETPYPAPGFRAETRRFLEDRLAAKVRAPRQIALPRLRLLIASYAGTGAALLAVAAVGLAGVGPFGA